jgi:hypothetical protein
MNKKHIVLFVFLLNTLYNIFALSHGESYYCTEEWYQGNKIGGEVRTQLSIIKNCDNVIEILIEKDMTPFSQALHFSVKAKYEIDKYVFHCRDNWDNTVFGYFAISPTENEKLVFFLDCNNFSDSGKNVARLYGETTILTKGAIMGKK